MNSTEFGKLFPYAEKKYFLNDDGEVYFMVGVRASGEKFRDNVVIVGENVIPAVKDLVENKITKNDAREENLPEP